MQGHDTRVSILPNGLTVVTASMASAKSISLGYWVKAGARDETASEHGMAHLLEHMAFKGTERRDAAMIAREVEDRGGFINAHTSREETAYYLRLMPEDIGFGVDLLADLLTRSTYPDNELVREKNVIVQEIGQSHDTPDDLIFDLYQGIAHGDHALARPILGTVESVTGFSRDNIHAFLGRHYAADNIIVAASGRVDHDDFVAMVGEAFSPLSAAADTMPRHASPWPGMTAPRRLIHHRELEQAHLVMGLKGMSVNDDDALTLALLSVLYGGGMSSRLFQEAREKRGLCYSVFSYPQGYADCGQLTIYAGTSVDDAAEMVKLAGAEMATLATAASADETARARAQIRASLMMRQESVASVCESLPRHLIYFGRIIPVAEQLEKISGITEADIRRVASRLIEEPPVLAAIGPLADGDLPDEDSLRSAFAA